MPSHVILLSGIWMPGLTLTVLRKRLEHAGYAVEEFDYRAVASPTGETLEALRQRLRVHSGDVHLVGHSLGGLLALLACRDADDLPSGRIVCLASPLTGSGAARELAAHGGAWMLGGSREVLEHGLDAWDGAREVGMIAGRAHVGLGALAGYTEGDSDGTVAVAETHLPGIADHCVVHASHTNILFSRDAAAQTLAFLRDGRFRHDAGGVA